MFHFTLVHVPGSHHGPDRLSCRQPQPGDEEEPEDDFEDWIDSVNGFMHFANNTQKRPNQQATVPSVACYHNNLDRQPMMSRVALCTCLPHWSRLEVRSDQDDEWQSMIYPTNM